MSTPEELYRAYAEVIEECISDPPWLEAGVNAREEQPVPGVQVLTYDVNHPHDPRLIVRLLSCLDHDEPSFIAAIIDRSGAGESLDEHPSVMLNHMPEKTVRQVLRAFLAMVQPFEPGFDEPSSLEPTVSIQLTPAELLHLWSDRPQGVMTGPRYSAWSKLGFEAGTILDRLLPDEGEGQ